MRLYNLFNNSCYLSFVNEAPSCLSINSPLYVYFVILNAEYMIIIIIIIFSLYVLLSCADAYNNYAVHTARRTPTGVHCTLCNIKKKSNACGRR